MVTRIPFVGNFRVTGKFWQTTGVWTPNNPHKGIDLVGETSTTVYGTCNGTVLFSGYDRYGFGNYVKVKSENGDYHYFCHLKKYFVSRGDTVTYTTKLGIMGASGNVTGAHTHYEIRRYTDNKNYTLQNPAVFMGIENAKGSYKSSDYPYNENPETPPTPSYKYKVGDLVRSSSCYGSSTAKLGFPPIGEAKTPAKGCETGRIVEILEGTNNPYKIEDWYFVNDGDIREVKN
ncbi:MAG: M23 family metallopeptidase [Clostridia bacterium]